MRKIILNSLTPSALLIFLGYCHLHFLYVSQFDIDIYHFIYSGEIILSFLPIAFRLFFLALPFLFIITAHYSNNANKVERQAGHDFNVYKRLFFRKIRRFTLRQKIFLLFKIATHYEFLIFIGGLLLSLVVFYYDLYKDEIIAITFFPVLAIWALFLLRKPLLLGTQFFFARQYKVIYWTGAFILVFMLVDFLNIYFEAENIKHGMRRKAVKFSYEHKRIDTFKDESISYIGATQQYVFIYDRKKEYS